MLPAACTKTSRWTDVKQCLWQEESSKPQPRFTYFTSISARVTNTLNSGVYWILYLLIFLFQQMFQQVFCCFTQWGRRRNTDDETRGNNKSTNWIETWCRWKGSSVETWRLHATPDLLVNMNKLICFVFNVDGKQQHKHVAPRLKAQELVFPTDSRIWMKDLRHHNGVVSLYGSRQLATEQLTCLAAVKTCLQVQQQTFVNRRGLVLKKRVDGLNPTSLNWSGLKQQVQTSIVSLVYF